MKTLSKIALLGLIAVSPAVPSMLSLSPLGIDQALAAGRPSSPGNSEAAHENAGGGSDNANIASLAGGGNAAHASEQGLAHANDKSMVGKVRAYATLDAALAAITKSDDPAVKAYIDALLAD